MEISESYYKAITLQGYNTKMEIREPKWKLESENGN